MSFMHSMVYFGCKSGKRTYSADLPPDYVASRKAEVKQNRFVRVKKSVNISEDILCGVKAERLSKPQNPKDRVILYFHGGGFVVGSVKTRRMFTSYLADKAGYDVVAVEYRLAPEYPYPAAPEDCFNVYRELLKEYKTGNIVLLGESAGGNLVLSVLLKIKSAGLPMPAAALCIAPCVQFDRTLPSYTENRRTEAMVDNLSEEVLDTYLQSKDLQRAKDPIFAPYYGDFSNCSPICLWASESEVLRDDSLILFKKLRVSGHNCRLYLRKKAIHTWLIIPYIPEAKGDLKTLNTCLKQAFDKELSTVKEPIYLK